MLFNIRLFFFGILLINGIESQAQTFEWANKAGQVPTNSNGRLETEAIAVDKGGGNYFVGSSDADTFIFANDTVKTNFGFYSRLNNLVVGKYTSNGKPVWGYSPTPIGGGVSGEDIAYYRGHLYVTGTFGDTVAFTANNTLIADKYGSAFIMKMDTAGNVKWVSKKDSAKGRCIAVRGSSVVIGGKKVDYSRDDTFSHFFAKYDTTGQFIKSINSKPKYFLDNTREVEDVGIDGNGNIIAGGYFRNSLTFGNTQIKTFPDRRSNDYDGFLVKFDKNFNVQWLEPIGGTSWKNLDNVRGVHVKPSGKFYATGSFTDSMLYRNNAFNGKGQNASAFIGEFQSNGKLNWLSKITGDAIGNAVTSTANSVLVTGNVDGPLAFFGNITKEVDGYYGDVYLAKLDKKGYFKYAFTTGATRNGYIRSGAFRPNSDIGTDSNNAIYSSGGFAGEISFGNKSISSSGSFVTKGLLRNKQFIFGVY